MPQLARPAYGETVLGKQVGHCVGGLEPVTDVGHVVDPERAGRVGCDAMVLVGGLQVAVVVALAKLLVVARVGHRLHQTLIGVLAEHGRHDCADANAGQQARVVPRHHFGQAPHAQLPKRTVLHAMASRRPTPVGANP